MYPEDCIEIKTLGDNWEEIKDISHVFVSGNEIMIVAWIDQDYFEEGDEDDCSNHVYRPPVEKIILRAKMTKIKEPFETFIDD